MDQPIDYGFADRRIFEQFEPALGFDLRGDDDRSFCFLRYNRNGDALDSGPPPLKGFLGGLK